jgi:plastocyanin
MISGVALAAEFNIEMKNKAFSVKSLQIKPGDTVSFKNGDTFSHNIFSLSEAKSFDLGSFSHYQSRSVTFDEAGTVHVECAMHAEEKMTITIRR